MKANLTFLEKLNVAHAIGGSMVLPADLIPELITLLKHRNKNIDTFAEIMSKTKDLHRLAERRLRAATAILVFAAVFFLSSIFWAI